MDVTVPDLGDFADVEVIDILVKPGDVVAVDDSLITLETDKATMDVPSPAAGKVREVKVGAGSTVSKGDLIVVLDAEAASVPGTTPGRAAEAESPAGAESGASAGGGAAAGRAGAGAEATDGEALEPAESEPAESEPAESEPAESEPAESERAEPELVRVPDLGDFHDVDVIEVLVAVGDEIAAEQGLITLETDKATMDVPSPVAGRVLEIEAEVGGTVNPGDAVALIQPSAAKSPAAQAGAKAGAAQSARTSAPPPPRRAEAAAPQAAAAVPRATALPAVGIVDETAFSRAHASPSVRKLARELGVDLGRVTGSGPKGRVTAEDVKGFVRRIMTEGAPGGALPRVPEVDFAKFGPVERVKLTRIQKISGPRLQASWLNLPHVTQHDEADITDLEDRRQALKQEAAERNIKLTPLAFVMRAVVLTLEEFPQFRSSLAGDGASLVVKDYYRIGFAADTPSGLVVPVIRDADRKDIFELASALGALSAKAREGKLGPDDVSGGVFTISSLGGIGGSFFTPIINAPEVAILGVSRSSVKPIYDGTQFQPRLMLPLSLSYDHRVIDGALAARFITRLSAILGEAERLVAAIP